MDTFSSLQAHSSCCWVIRVSAASFRAVFAQQRQELFIFQSRVHEDVEDKFATTARRHGAVTHRERRGEIDCNLNIHSISIVKNSTEALLLVVAFSWIESTTLDSWLDIEKTALLLYQLLVDFEHSCEASFPFHTFQSSNCATMSHVCKRLHIRQHQQH